MVDKVKKGPAPAQSTVTESDAGQRLDRWLKGIFPNLPYIGVQKLTRQGKVRVNGVKAQASARLERGDVVSYPMDVRQNARPGADKAAYQVTKLDTEMMEEATLFEDNAMLVLNKPAGLPAQAGGGQVRSLDRMLEGLYGEDRAPKLVHRLDRETTGILVCGKNRTNAAALTAQFAARETQKEYLAVVLGKLPGKQGEIKQPIAKVGPFARVDKGGDPAHTSWKWLASEGELHLISCVPHTGRMNQLRVHMEHIGLPMLGDDKYGKEVVKAAGKALHGSNVPLYLHAWKLKIKHPQDNETMAFEAPLPAHFAAIAKRMGWQE